MPKRGDRVAPPPSPGEWELQHATTEAANGWEDLCKQAPNATRAAYDCISKDPYSRENPQRQHPLKGAFAAREIKGEKLEQWQFEVTGGGRVWYCPSKRRRIVFLTFAGVGHPKATEP